MLINIDHTLSESSQAPQQKAVVLTLESLLFNQFKMRPRLAAYVATEENTNENFSGPQYLEQLGHLENLPMESQIILTTD